MRATTSEARRTQEIIFGDLPEVVDYVYTVASLVPMLLHDIEGAEAVQFQAARFAELKNAATTNFDRLTAEFAPTQAGLALEVDRLRQGLKVLDEAKNIANAGKEIDKNSDRKKRDLLFGLLDAEAVDIGTELRLFSKARSQEINGFDSGSKSKFRDADSLVADASRESGTERSALLRQARKTYLELTKEAGASSAPILWACCAWMTWQHTGNLNEAVSIVENALVHAQMAAKVGYALLTRVYAYFLAKLGRDVEAYKWASIAAKSSPSAGAFHERASYAVKAETDERLKADIEAFFKRSRLSIVVAFSDPRFSSLNSSLLDYAMSEQKRLTRQTTTAIGRWVDLAKKVQDAQNVAGQFHVPKDLLEGAKLASSGAVKADFMAAAELLLTAGESCVSLKNVAQSSLESERLRMADAKEQAKRSIDELIQQRDQYMNLATESQRGAVLESRKSLSDVDTSSEKVHKKFAWGMGSGCAIFSLYLLSAGALSMKGLQLGAKSPAGIAAIVVSGIPVAYAVVVYLVHSTKRNKLEEEIRQEIAAKSRAHDSAVRDADDQVRAQLTHLRKQLEESEKRLAQVESAQRLLV